MNIKEEKGSMAVYVTIVLLSMLFILIAVFLTSNAFRDRQLKTAIKVKESYEKDIDRADEIYDDIVNVEPEQKTFKYDYTGNEQIFVAPASGYYKIEAWGAQGNNVSTKRSVGGLGGYTSGEIKLNKGDKLYIYVGEHRTDRLASFNCGSVGGTDVDPLNGGGANGYGGGGATDIRTVSGDNWSDFDSLKSRIMVAAGGGGGSDYSYTAKGGYGGGLTGESGYNGKYPNYGVPNTPPTGGTQTSGGKTSQLSTTGGATGTNGTFGKGGNGNSLWGSAGGGGYYGGGGGGYTGYSVDSGAGGSSFISGHSGCNAISVDSTETSIKHTGLSGHYSGLVFTNTVMKDGSELMPTPENGTSIGNEGNGYAKITWVGSEATKPEYEKIGLLNHYDAINNTGNGHDNGATTWKDLSGNNKDITQISGSIGEDYIQLDGTQSMQIPLSGNFTDMSVEFTVSDIETRDTTLFNAYGAYTRLISVHVPWSDNNIYFDSSHNSNQIGSGYERINKQIDFDKNKKHTLTFIKSTTQGQSIYLDGNLWTQNPNQKRPVGNVTGAILGRGQNDLSNSIWKGKIYSVRIYSKALSQQEITNNYNIDKERFGM